MALTIKQRFMISFMMIFFLVFIFGFYFIYVFTEIEKSIKKEYVFSKNLQSVINIYNLNLRNHYLLSMYHDLYDKSLTSQIIKNEALIAKEINYLQQSKISNASQENLNNYVQLMPKQRGLQNKIIQLINQSAPEAQIKLLRYEKDAIDNKSDSYVKQLIEIKKDKIDQVNNEEEKQRNQLKHAIITLFIIVIFLSFCISCWIIRSITAPIRDLTRMANEITQGNLDAKTTLDSKDELGQLGSTLNHMTEILKASHNENARIMTELKNEVDKHTKAELSIKKQAEEIQFIAYHDHLTGIYNRAQFEEFGIQSVITAERNLEKIAIMLIDLDGFKHINDSLGHATGDLLLKTIATRFQSMTRKSDMLARIGGDEFAVIIHSFKNTNAVELIAQKILRSTAEPLMIDGNKINITASVGISIYPESGQDMTELMKQADIALYKAKEHGKNTFCLFEKSYNNEIQRSYYIKNQLEKMLSEDKYYLVFQPIYSLGNHSLYCIEALLRSHDDIVNVAIEESVMVAERFGLIIPIGQWIIKAALTQYQHWQARSKHKIKLSINLSTQQIARSDFVDFIKETLLKLSIDPRNIIFEITETALIRDLKLVISSLQELKNMGCGIFIDDFGTGYTSLNLVRDLPITGLKIDKSFVQKMNGDAKNIVLIKMIFELARTMHLTVISEGVESKAHLDFIKAFDTDQKIQGYYFSKPLEITEVTKLITE